MCDLRGVLIFIVSKKKKRLLPFTYLDSRSLANEYPHFET